LNRIRQKQPRLVNDKKLYKVQERFLFHAHIRIKLPISCDNEIFDELFRIMEEIDRKYNSYSEGSTIDRINKNAGKFTKVDEETICILEKVKSYSELFDGLYDITIMPLIRLWGFYKDDERRVPTNDEIRKTIRFVDYRNIEIDGLYVKIGEGQEIITGSFIKAYAVDKVLERIKSEHITDAVINAGGSTIAAVNDEVHPYWQVNVTDSSKREEKLFTINLNNLCFSTSSQSKTFVEIGGKQYGHILNPKTGYPSSNIQVGVISPDCFSGDIISTALFNISDMDFEKVINKISEKISLSAFLMNEKGNIIRTEDFDNYI